MQLMTKEIEKKFEKYPLYSQDGKGEDAQVLVKYFSPASSHTWYVLEGNKLENGDFEMFGLSIERDLYTQLGSLGEMLKREGRA